MSNSSGAGNSRRIAPLLALCALFGACGEAEADALRCVEDLPMQCTPAFDPTWPNVYANVVQQSCGGAGTGTSCHASEGKQGGLELTSATQARSALLGELDGKPRVIPGDPACSILMERIHTSDPELLMPRGGPRLSEQNLCAVQQWIQQGAQP